MPDGRNGRVARPPIVSIQKHVDALAHPSVGCSQCGVLPGFLPARGHGQRVNQLEPEPRSFCSFSSRPSIKPRLPSPSPPSAIRYPAPLLGSSSATFVVVPPLYGIPLHFTCVGKTASNGQFQIPCPLPSPPPSPVQTASIRSETPKLFRQ